MSNLNVHFDVNFSARFVRLALTGAMLLAAASQLASESVSLTTYYPAPSGVYTQLIATGNAYMARDAGFLDVGTNAPSTSKVTIDVATGGYPTAIDVRNGGVRQFALNPTAGGGWQMYDGVGGAYNARVTDAGGNIGIGTSSPASALSVNGGVQLGTDAAACTAALAGTERWNSGAVQVCNGAMWGPIGASNTFSVTASYVAWRWPNGSATCPAGTTVTGGGGHCYSALGYNFIAQTSPNGSNGWYVSCDTPNNETAYLTVWAQCMPL
ncbi:MAG: hypothetical protein HKL90_10335 [Elusimicrobia bacterium]|nr:hypothetical protein [Elusimicrobiota bacterium]